MGVLDNLTHVQVDEEEDEGYENPREDEDRSLGLREDALRSQEEDGALRPPLQPAALRPDQGPLPEGEVRGGHQEDDQRGQVSPCVSNGEIPACCHPHHPRKQPPEQRPPVLDSRLLRDVLRRAGQQRHGSLRQEEAQRIHTRPRQCRLFPRAQRGNGRREEQQN